MIFWINTPFDALPGEGGRPMRYWLLSRALVAAGHEVVLWASDFHHVTKTRRALDPIYEAEGFQVRLVPTHSYRANVGLRRVISHRLYARRWSLLARKAVVQEGLRPPDCILTSMPPLGLFREAARMRAAWGCRVVVDIQDAWPETFYRLLPRGLRWLALVAFGSARRLAHRAYRQADGVTAVAEAYLQLARASGCLVPTARFPLGTPLPLRVAADHVDNTRPLVLCYVGNLGERYDLQTLIDGVRRLVDEGVAVKLTVAGDGPQRARIIEAVRQGAPITFRGYLDDKALQACLSECDVGVVPMFADSWVAVPNKLIDYAAAGLAIVNGLKGEAQTLLDNHEAGVAYETGSAVSLAAAVRRYADDRDLLARHRQAARRLAEAEFDAARIYPAMARWLESLTVKTGVPTVFRRFFHSVQPNAPAPPGGERPVWRFSFAVLVAFFLLYAFTAQRGVSWQDSGEFQYRTLVGDYHWHSGIARAHPLYILLARCFAAGFAPAARFFAINLFSGLGMAMALAFLGTVVVELTRSRWRALLAVVLLGGAHMCWWMATIAEVYTWSLACLMAEVFLVWRYVTTRQGRWLIILFAVNGLHAAMHNAAFLNLPVHLMLLAGYLRAPESKPTAAVPTKVDDASAASAPCGSMTGATAQRWTLLAGVILAWLSGAAMLVGLTLQEVWCTGRLLAALQSLLFGTDYRGQVLGFQFHDWRQFAANLALAGLSLLNPGWLLAGVGLFKARIGALRKPLLALTLLHGLFWIRYFVPDQATFVLPILGLLAIWAGAGCGLRSECGVSADGVHGRTPTRLLPQTWRGGLAWIMAGVLTTAGLPWLLSHAADATGCEVRRGRQLPYRDEARYWLVPWKQNEDSAVRFVAAVGAQLDAADWLVADSTAAGPLLAARAAGRTSGHWHLVTPWSTPAEQEAAVGALAAGARVYAVSPLQGYAPAWLLAPEVRVFQEGILWRAVPAQP